VTALPLEGNVGLFEVPDVRMHETISAVMEVGDGGRRLQSRKPRAGVLRPRRRMRAESADIVQNQKGDTMGGPSSKKWVPKNTGDAIPIPGSSRSAVPQAKLIGKSDYKAQIKVSIYARQKPAVAGGTGPKLDQLNSKLPGQRHYLSGEDFNSSFGADPADLRNIAEWAKANKLKVLDSSVPKRRVLVQGTIGDMCKAFGTELNEYRQAERGHFRGRVGSLHVPAHLSGVVQAVFGLDTRPVGRPRNRRGNFEPVKVEAIVSKDRGKLRDVALAIPASPFEGAFFPPTVAQLYDYPQTDDGSGENVAVFAFNGGGSLDPRGGYSLAALQNYYENVLGGKTPAVKNVVVQGPGNDPGPDTQASSNRGDSTGEVMLDMCVVGSVAPGANIFMYFTEFTSQGWVDALQEAITDDNEISVLSISYGNPEDDPQGAWTAMGVQLVNQAFQAATAKGITVCCASGDDGSSDQVATGAHVDFPASSPFVLGVGGTKLVASAGTPPAIQSETVWNEIMQTEGATGGGVSAVFAKPTYQNAANVPPSANPPHNVGRGVPDVAAVADPVTGVVVMRIDGKHLEPIGGTSAAAPLWASLVARLNQGLKARCGFLNPILYSNAFRGAFRDVTVGNNGAYSATVGWDACTGLGSPIGQQLLNALSSTDAQAKGAGG
jgi:kumamolisin